MDEVGRDSRRARSEAGRLALDGRFASGASRVASSVPGRSSDIMVATADGGSGVRHAGQDSPASCGRMTAAQAGQEMLGTALGV